MKDSVLHFCVIWPTIVQTNKQRNPTRGRVLLLLPPAGRGSILLLPSPGSSHAPAAPAQWPRGPTGRNLTRGPGSPVMCEERKPDLPAPRCLSSGPARERRGSRVGPFRRPSVLRACVCVRACVGTCVDMWSQACADKFRAGVYRFEQTDGPQSPTTACGS